MRATECPICGLVEIPGGGIMGPPELVICIACGDTSAARERFRASARADLDSGKSMEDVAAARAMSVETLRRRLAEPEGQTARKEG